MWWTLLIPLAVSLPAQSPPRAEYVGGTLAGIGKSGGSIDLSDSQFFSFRMRDRAVRVPYGRINLLEYGQKVDRRYVTAILISPLLLLSKSRKHFLTIGYTDEAENQQAIVLRVGKNGIRPVLVGLEAKTGRKVQFQDEEARKAGKG